MDRWQRLAQAWLLALLCGAFCLNSQASPAETLAVDVQSLKAREIISLKGPWDFYWAQWVEPGTEPVPTLQHMAGRTWTPGELSTYRQGEGYATYRLILQHVKPLRDGYSLAIRNASAAMKVMVYPRNSPERVHIATAGKIADNPAEEIPQLRLTTLRFFPEADETEWVILIQISNFHYSRGGLWNVPVLGAGDAAEARMSRDREFLLFCLGMIMVIGVYNCVLFVRRSTDKATLMLAIFCAVVCIRSSFADNLLSWYFPQLDTRLYHLKYFWEYATIVLGPLACVSFVHMSFLPAAMPRFYRLCVNLSLLSGLGMVVLDTYYRSLAIVAFEAVTVVLIVYGLCLLARAVRQGLEEARVSAAGGFMISACVIYDILVTFDIFPQPYITSIGMSVFVFMQSQVVANRFAKAFNMAEHLSHGLKEEVERQTLELRSIMENIPQGVFIMLADQTIQGNYSRQLEELLGTRDLIGRKALPVLFRNASLNEEDLSIIDSILVAAFHEPVFAWELNAHSLPREFTRDDQVFEVEWHPIVSRQDTVDRVLVTLRNVTDFRALQANQRKDQQAFALLLEIVQVAPSRFRDFIQQSWDIIRQAEREAQNQADESVLRLRKVLMRLHTWKGLCRSLGLRTLTARIHEAEQNLQNAQDPLQEIHDLQDRLASYESLEKERLGRLDTVYASETSPESRRLLAAWYRYHYQPVEPYRDELHRALTLFIGTLPGVTIGQLITSVKQDVPGLARELHKAVPRVEGRGALHRPLPEGLYKSLHYVLQHLIRNSLDHGLENADERRQKHKAAEGLIVIRFEVQDGMLLLDFQDDGRGLNLDLVLAQARRQQIPAAAEARSAQEIAALIFAPGFSTKTEVNTISGRGIGMDAVRLLVEEAGGTLALSLDQAGFHLRAQWPLMALLEEAA